MLNAAFGGFIDFLFPKDLSVLALEAMDPEELLKSLRSVSDLGEDTIALFPYSDSQVKELIWELKYRKNEVLVKKLALILSDVLREELADRALFDNFTKPLLIPMPMSQKRRLERGWNQTEALCEALKDNAFEYASDILEKVRHTESQTDLEKQERLQNLLDSMKVRDRDRIKNRNVILLDDVITTGASFAEAKRALHLSGAKKILCVALAH